jgi:hypothetical protein
VLKVNYVMGDWKTWQNEVGSVRFPTPPNFAFPDTDVHPIILVFNVLKAYHVGNMGLESLEESMLMTEVVNADLLSQVYIIILNFYALDLVMLAANGMSYMSLL